MVRDKKEKNDMDWDAYAKHINDSVRKPDRHAGLSPEAKEWAHKREQKLAIEKLLSTILTVGCAVWIISWDFLLLIPVLGIVGGLRHITEIDRGK